MIYAMNHEEVLFYQAFSIQISCLIDQRIVTLGSKLNYFSIYWLSIKLDVLGVSVNTRDSWFIGERNTLFGNAPM